MWPSYDFNGPAKFPSWSPLSRAPFRVRPFFPRPKGPLEFRIFGQRGPRKLLPQHQSHEMVYPEVVPSYDFNGQAKLPKLEPPSRAPFQIRPFFPIPKGPLEFRIFGQRGPESSFLSINRTIWSTPKWCQAMISMGNRNSQNWSPRVAPCFGFSPSSLYPRGHWNSGFSANGDPESSFLGTNRTIWSTPKWCQAMISMGH